MKNIKQGNYRDAITHIYGTINEEKEKKYITFFGFKCISGKTLFVGNPKGKGFLFGKFGYKFHYLTLQLNKDGITYLELGFKENLRKNFFSDKISGKFSEQELEKNEIINDEEILDKLNDKDEIEQLITTSILPEDSLNKNNLKEENPGKDYKEVVDQFPRQWIINSTIVERDGKKINESPSLEEALNSYDELSKVNLSSSIKKSDYSISQNYIPLLSSYNLNLIEKMELPFIPNLFAYEEQKEEYSNDRKEKSEEKKLILPRKPKIIYKPEFKESILANGTKIKIIKRDWDGNTDKPINPNIFFNKDNYKRLMDKIKENILEDFKKYGTEEDEKMINEVLGEKTVIYSKTKKCYLKLQKLQTEIKRKNKIENLLNKEKRMPKQISVDKINQDPDKYKDAQLKWQFFRKKIEKINGIFLLQTIGSIIRANLLMEGKIDLPLEKQVKLHQIFNENKKIIDFLNKESEEDEKDELVKIRNTILIPNEHSEKITSLEELQEKLDGIKKLLKKEDLNKEQRLKLESSEKFYLKQKNTLIENETENLKRGGGKGFMKIIFENIGKYLGKERDKISKAREEEKKNNKKKNQKKEKKSKKKGTKFSKTKKKLAI